VQYFVASINYLKLDAALILSIKAVITVAADVFVYPGEEHENAYRGAIKDPIADK
jgi:hypothetical protein